MKLEVKNLVYEIEGTRILDNATLHVKEGEFVGLLGPNGCGKSTLLKNVYKTLKPHHKSVFIDGKDVMELNPKEMARKAAVMSQENSVAFDLEVIDMVMYGRYSHRRFLEGEKKEDHALCLQTLKEVGMEGYEHRSFLSLSGGEKQRVLLARALVQEASLILLDEPTNHLDIRFQYQIMQTLCRQNITIFSSVHDLNIAAMFCDRLVLMNKGTIVMSGTPEEVITEETIQNVFGVKAQVTKNSITGKVQIYYLPE